MIKLFNDNLEKALKKKGINKKELAEILEISSPSVTAWKTKGTYPTIEKFIKICQVLEVSADELLDLSPPGTPPQEKAPPDVKNQFSRIELQLIDQFRELTIEQQEDILDNITSKIERNKRKEKSLNSAV